MRIVAGIAKGRRLVSPKGGVTRPLTDRVKEALFSSLGDTVVGTTVLDLFAGAGSIGLEALSRGASGVDFVEQDRRVIESLEKNVAAVGLGGRVIRHDATSTTMLGGPYGLVFVDPPYEMDTSDVAALLSDLTGHLADGAIVIVHRRTGDTMPMSAGSLSLVSQRRYGDGELWRYEAQEEVPQ